MVGGEFKCGKAGEPCKKAEDYRVCDPEVESEDWIGKREIFVPVNKTARSTYHLVPGGKDKPDEKKYRPITFDEVRLLLQRPDGKINPTFERMGRYICRSDGEEGPYDYFVVNGEGMAEKVAYFSENPAGSLKETKGFAMLPGEMVAFAKALDLNEDNVCLKKGFSPTKVNNSWTKGTYIFNNKDYDALNDMIAKLEDDQNFQIPGLSEGTRKVLTEHLKTVLASTQFEQSKAESRRNRNLSMGVGVLMGLPMFIYFGHMGFKSVKNWWLGRIQTEDVAEEMLDRLRDDPNYHVKGLEEKAREAWRRLRTSTWPNLIIQGPTGAGKDMLGEEMINLLVRGDPSVPKEFHKARVLRITPAMIQANTQYRGNVADNVVDIFKRATKGSKKGQKTVLYLEEIDHILLSGNTSEGSSEMVSELLLAEIRKKLVKENVVIIGSTSRPNEIKLKADNLVRRFIWTTKDYDPLSLSIENFDGPERREIEQKFKVKVDREMIEIGGRLAEVYYRPSTVTIDMSTGVAKTTIAKPRYDAIKELIALAAGLAQERGVREVQIQDLVAATNQLCEGKSRVTAEDIPVLRFRDADSLMTSDLPAEGKDKYERAPIYSDFADLWINRSNASGVDFATRLADVTNAWHRVHDNPALKWQIYLGMSDPGFAELGEEERSNIAKEMLDIMDSSKVSREAMRKAMEVTEEYIPTVDPMTSRPQLPRFRLFLQLLDRSAQIAENEGSGEVAVEHVNTAANMMSVGAGQRQPDSATDFVRKLEADPALKALPLQHADEVRKFARERLVADAARYIADPSYGANPANFILNRMNAEGVQLQPIQPMNTTGAFDPSIAARRAEPRGWERLKFWRWGR